MSENRLHSGNIWETCIYNGYMYLVGWTSRMKAYTLERAGEVGV